jgi:probable F420-dependent oxidoreductase
MKAGAGASGVEPSPQGGLRVDEGVLQMRFGFVLPNNWGVVEARKVADLAVEAEDLGIDSVWVNHHVVNIGYVAERLGDRPYHDALTTLTWAAARTERVKLGTSVLVAPYLHPMNLAKALATLDQLSGGRVIAGLGVGSLPEENAVLGVGYDDRGRYADEAIQVMQTLWDDGAASFAGDHFSFSGVISSPKPIQTPLPVWIGGTGRPARRRAARFGQGWHPMCSAAGLTRRMPQFEQALSEVDRVRADIVVAPRIDVRDIPDAGAVSAFLAAGADELIVSTSSADLGEIRPGLAHIAHLAQLTR